MSDNTAIVIHNALIIGAIVVLTVTGFLVAQSGVGLWSLLLMLGLAESRSTNKE
jgi:hypothetical protein